jgi:transcriptional regulator with XRE-family HTH domain
LLDLAKTRARSLEQQAGRELRDARLDRNLSLREVCAAVGLSIATGSRIERGLVHGVALERLARMGAAVGLDLSTRFFPAGSPLRDAGHSALLERLRTRLHRTLRFRTEIPLPIRGDLRAWDAAIDGRGWWIPVEAETKPRDFQALDRRIALKQRDAEVDRVVLLLGDSRHNRELIRANEAGLRARYPLAGQRALELLAAGVELRASAIIVL